MKRLFLIPVAALIAIGFLPGTGSAQLAYTLSLNTQTVTVPVPTATEYNNGFSAATQSITYTVSALNLLSSKTVTVKIKSISTSLGGGKAIADLQWQRSGTSTWTSLATTDATTQTGTLSLASSSFTGTLFFRVILRWETDPPASYSATINISITV